MGIIMDKTPTQRVMASKSFRLANGILRKVYNARVDSEMVIDFDDDITQAVLLKQLSETPHHDPECAWLGFRLVSDDDYHVEGAMRRDVASAAAVCVIWPHGATAAEAFACAFEGVDANA